MYIGFQHKVCVAFCSCEPEAVTLVRHSMWPASPKNPKLAFQQDLLLWLESLVFEGCIGVDAFCRASPPPPHHRIDVLTSALLHYAP